MCCDRSLLFSRILLFLKRLKIFCCFVELRINTIDFLLFLAPFAVLHLDETEIASAFLSIPPISPAFSESRLAHTDNVHFHLMIFSFSAPSGIALMNHTHKRIYPQVVTQQETKRLVINVDATAVVIFDAGGCWLQFTICDIQQKKMRRLSNCI